MAAELTPVIACGAVSQGTARAWLAAVCRAVLGSSTTAESREQCRPAIA
jgi:hypothetical protein